MANGNLKEKLAAKAGANVPEKKPLTLADQLQAMVPQFAKALPRHMSPDRLARIALTLYRQNPGLAQCSPQSFFGALMQAAQLGLEPGLVGHAWLVPFNNKRTGQKEVQFIIGYQGMIDLARRSGQILSLMAKEVFVNDHFKLIYGLHEALEHVPWHLREDKKIDEPGEFRGVYFIAHLKDGGHIINYMPAAEIEEHRVRSKSPDDGPWKTDYMAMAKKTIVRNTFRWLPVSIEVREQIEARDESVRMTVEDAIDISWEAVPPESPPDVSEESPPAAA